MYLVGWYLTKINKKFKRRRKNVKYGNDVCVPMYVYVWFRKTQSESVNWTFYILCNADEGGDNKCQENMKNIQ